MVPVSRRGDTLIDDTSDGVNCRTNGLKSPAFATAPIFVLVGLQGGPKKVSHYRESSLNRIKNRQPG